MSVAVRRPRPREQSAAVAFPLVIGSLRFDLTVEPSHRPVAPMSVRLCGHLWGGCLSGPDAGKAGARVLRDLAAGSPQISAVSAWLRPGHFSRAGHSELYESCGT